MAHYKSPGIVLRTIRLGEADRIVSLLTPEHGKVRAVAKGVRRTKSRIGARLEPLTAVEAMLWRGRELDVVAQVEVTESFRHLRADLDRLADGLAMLEILDAAAVERQGAPELFQLLSGGLTTLERAPSPVVFGAFCFRFLQIEGVGPVADACVVCGRHLPLVAFSYADGGFCCAEHRRGQACAPELAVLVSRISSGELGRVLAEGHENRAGALSSLGLGAVEHLLGRRIRAHRVGLEAAETAPAAGR